MIKIKENSNYLAKIFKIKDIRKHENADRLQCLNVDFQKSHRFLKAEVDEIEESKEEILD